MKKSMKWLPCVEYSNRLRYFSMGKTQHGKDIAWEKGDIRVVYLLMSVRKRRDRSWQFLISSSERRDHQQRQVGCKLRAKGSVFSCSRQQSCRTPCQRTLQLQRVDKVHEKPGWPPGTVVHWGWLRREATRDSRNPLSWNQLASESILESHMPVLSILFPEYLLMTSAGDRLWV